MARQEQERYSLYLCLYLYHVVLTAVTQLHAQPDQLEDCGIVVPVQKQEQVEEQQLKAQPDELEDWGIVVVLVVQKREQVEAQQRPLYLGID